MFTQDILSVPVILIQSQECTWKSFKLDFKSSIWATHFCSNFKFPSSLHCFTEVKLTTAKEFWLELMPFYLNMDHNKAYLQSFWVSFLVQGTMSYTTSLHQGSVNNPASCQLLRHQLPLGWVPDLQTDSSYWDNSIHEMPKAISWFSQLNLMLRVERLELALGITWQLWIR